MSSKSLPLSEFTLSRRVQFHEADPAGIVHFSSYFRYMEEAEHALWRAAGLSIAPQGADLGFPRVSTSCEYLKPLQFEDVADVQIRIVRITNRSMHYACTIRCGSETAATLSLVIVCVHPRADGSFAAMPIPHDIVSRFAAVPEDGL